MRKWNCAPLSHRINLINRLKRATYIEHWMPTFSSHAKTSIWKVIFSFNFNLKEYLILRASCNNRHIHRYTIQTVVDKFHSSHSSPLAKCSVHLIKVHQQRWTNNIITHWQPSQPNYQRRTWYFTEFCHRNFSNLDKFDQLFVNQIRSWNGESMPNIDFTLLPLIPSITPNASSFHAPQFLIFCTKKRSLRFLFFVSNIVHDFSIKSQQFIPLART